MRRADMRCLLPLALLLAPVALPLLGGCQASNPGFEGGDPTSPTTPVVTDPLTVSPPEISLTVDGQPVTGAFKAQDKAGADVTDRAVWTIDQGYATVAKGQVTVPATLIRGGVATVTATLGSQVGTARLRVKVVGPDITVAGVPEDPRGLFKGAPAATAPQVIYPFDGTMLARNINGMRPAWSGSAESKFYRVSFDAPLFQQTVYTTASACTGGTQCSYLLDDQIWARIVDNAGGDVTMTVSRTAGAGQPVGTAVPVRLSFSPQPVRGGLYYFATTGYGLMRLPFGASQAQVFIRGKLAQNPNDRTVDRCVGCHAVSADGKKVAAVWAGGDGYGGIVDGADPTKYLMRPTAAAAGQVWNFASFSPDAKRLITVWKGEMSLRDGDTGALIRKVDVALLGGRAAMPEWSPDGKSIVFVRLPSEGKLGADLSLACTGGPCVVAGDWIIADSGDIAVLPVNGDGSFGQSRTIVPRTQGQEYHFYPSFSPDSRWIVFNSAKTAACGSPTAANNGVGLGAIKCITYDQNAARLRLVRAAEGQQAIELAAATRAAGKTTAWPKFAPFQQGSLVFFTFSSKFDYGWVVQQASIRAATGLDRPQIWMSGVDLSKAESGQDPSFPPFWLPFQDPATNNHDVLWTRDIRCVSDSDCGSEFMCVDGQCVPKLG